MADIDMEDSLFDDDLFGYGLDLDKIPVNPGIVELPDREEADRALREKENAAKKDKGANALGLDETVEVKTRTRAPALKLDSNLILGEKGIPALRSTVQEKLGKRLKGKGHEYSDARRILQFYQVWAHGLYPKAKFDDVLVMIEKLGHSKRLQVARQDWVLGHLRKDKDRELERVGDAAKRKSEDEGEGGSNKKTRTDENNVQEDKLFWDDDDDELFAAPGSSKPAQNSRGETNTEKEGNLFFSDDEDDFASRPSRPRGYSDEPDMDELDALMTAESAMPKQGATKPFSQPSNEDDPDMDELDALLAAENSARSAPANNTTSKTTSRPPEDDEFDFDDLDMLREMEDNAVKEKEAAQKRGPRRVVEDDEEEEFDLEGMAALQETETAQGSSSKTPRSSAANSVDAQHQKGGGAEQKAINVDVKPSKAALDSQLDDEFDFEGLDALTAPSATATKQPTDAAGNDGSQVAASSSTTVTVGQTVQAAKPVTEEMEEDEFEFDEMEVEAMEAMIGVEEKKASSANA